ncbi:protein phosphatase 1 regulatory subunit 35 isoform X2 [Mastacembelus armatus]|uniref:protein phosphatase 1 regulatory subunit 35 isoform X2 n=1 Tax=Mastacembelus armatus TaxID=205130 RepID=UPI000E45D5D0|nr:protein phosphatase 1 regulatory subunit 35 isoform X2 [Mastacembelus armatus]
MRSSASFLSPPPSPHPAPFPLPSASSVTHCPELDLSVMLSPAPNLGHTHPKPRPLKASHQMEHTELKSHSRGHARRKKNTQVCSEEPLVITVTAEPHITVSQRSQRRSTGHHNGPRESVEPLSATSNQDPACLERAELNTTLALKAELQSLQGVVFNSQKAIQETLRSEKTKHLINTRATEVVNVSRSQNLFKSLVSIRVQEDQLISQVMQDRLSLAPPTHCPDNKEADGPSLLPFMTSDLFRQKPLAPEEGSVDCKLHPTPYPTQLTFDLFRRKRRWEAMP